MFGVKQKQHQTIVGFRRAIPLLIIPKIAQSKAVAFS
jgi:hypothetical protein